jgi:hypothetical protein
LRVQPGVKASGWLLGVALSATVSVPGMAHGTPSASGWTYAKAADVLWVAPGDAPLCEDADIKKRALCMLDARYDRDAQARDLARAMFERTGTLAGVHREDTFDGGFRGTIRIVPELPVGTHRRQLEWTTAAFKDIDEVMVAVAAKGSAQPRYRYRELELRFFRSVGRTTPSAFASGWTIGWNVSGSLHKNADAVRETLFHEIFHLNDGAHGDWSPKTLGRDYAAIVRKCGRDVSCLAPYAPGDTKVRGGTYYAFQPDNGVSVREYAAELALRWYREHRAIVRGETLAKPPFKCGPPENARAWRAMVDEFFAIDLVPPCP